MVVRIVSWGCKKVNGGVLTSVIRLSERLNALSVCKGIHQGGWWVRCDSPEQQVRVLEKWEGAVKSLRVAFFVVFKVLTAGVLQNHCGSICSKI